MYWNAYQDYGLAWNGLDVGWADLLANEAGFEFWKRFFQDPKMNFNICDYVSGNWDEYTNPNTKTEQRP